MTDLEKQNNLDFFKKDKTLIEKSLTALVFTHLRKKFKSITIQACFLAFILGVIPNFYSIYSNFSQFFFELSSEKSVKEYSNNSLQYLANVPSEKITNFNSYIKNIININNNYGNSLIESAKELKNSGKINEQEFLRVEQLINRTKSEFAEYLAANRERLIYTISKIKLDKNYYDKFGNYEDLNAQYNLFIKSLANDNYIYPTLINLKIQIDLLKESNTAQDKTYFFDGLKYYENDSKLE